MVRPAPQRGYDTLRSTWSGLPHNGGMNALLYIDKRLTAQDVGSSCRIHVRNSSYKKVLLVIQSICAGTHSIVYSVYPRTQVLHGYMYVNE